MDLISIWFNYPGSNAIDVVDEASNVSFGERPEWAIGGRSCPAAYVRGSTITLRAQFALEEDESPFELKVEVVGGGGSATLQYHGEHVDIPLGSLGLPNAIGVTEVKLRWSVFVVDEDWKDWVELTTTWHYICTTWQPMLAKADEGLTTSVYFRPLAWGCGWAAGRNDSKSICDAVIGSLAKSGLKYGNPVWDVHRMLLFGGGKCSGWAKMFQYILHCQGVHVYRRAFMVDWRSLPHQEVQWAAMVISAGGLNQTVPSVPPQDFLDDDAAFPIRQSAGGNNQTLPPAAPQVPPDLSQKRESRWVFWGCPGKMYEGHAVNFLVDQDKLYLYDPSFGTGPFAISMPLPPDDGSIWGGSQLASFKSVYLNKAVDYMMGSLRDSQGVLHIASRVPPRSTGITVKTSIIPDVIGTLDEITFYWAQG